MFYERGRGRERKRKRERDIGGGEGGVSRGNKVLTG